MRRLGILLALIVGAVVIYNLAFPSVTVRYRLTLEAQMDDSRKNGSGVIEVTYSKNPKLLPNEAEFRVSVRGQAVMLDLGKRGTLFALLKSGDDARSGAEWIVLRAFNFPGGALPSPVEKGLGDVRRLSGKVELPLAALPLLIHFRDLNDPKSVEKVDPLDIGKIFGGNARLVRATVEIIPAGIWPLSWYGATGEPITQGIEDRLAWWSSPQPWLKSVGNGVFVDTRTEALRVNKEDIKRE